MSLKKIADPVSEAFEAIRLAFEGLDPKQRNELLERLFKERWFAGKTAMAILEIFHGGTILLDELDRRSRKSTGKTLDRNLRMLTERRAGKSWAQLAADHGMTIGGARAAVKRGERVCSLVKRACFLTGEQFPSPQSPVKIDPESANHRISGVDPGE